MNVEQMTVKDLALQIRKLQVKKERLEAVRDQVDEEIRRVARKLMDMGPMASS